MYQTVFATETGSAEMPSAGRPFTPELVTRLVSSGIQIAPLVLHTGVASLEDHEPPYEEFYRVSPETAERVNAAQTRRTSHRCGRHDGRSRARNRDATSAGRRPPGEGWTSLVITPERPLRVVNAMITGLHEPHATHLTMLERVIDGARDAARSASHLERAYRKREQSGYLWHEFGDSHLIIGTQDARTSRDRGGFPASSHSALTFDRTRG